MELIAAVLAGALCAVIGYRAGISKASSSMASLTRHEEHYQLFIARVDQKFDQVQQEFGNIYQTLQTIDPAKQAKKDIEDLAKLMKQAGIDGAPEHRAEKMYPNIGPGAGHRNA